MLVVVGNKIDLKQRAVSKDKGKEFADTIKATYVETSAKDGEGINYLFLLLLCYYHCVNRIMIQGYYNFLMIFVGR